MEVIPRAENRPLRVQEMRQIPIYRSIISKKIKYAKNLIRDEWKEGTEDDLFYRGYLRHLKTVYRPFASRERDIKRIGMLL